jgi:hypothetical protein
LLKSDIPHGFKFCWRILAFYSVLNNHASRRVANDVETETIMLYTISRKARFLVLISISLFLIQSIQAQGRRIYVDAYAECEASGKTWQDAIPDLEKAFAMAVPGDSIWVSLGVYKPSKGSMFVIKSGVKVFGGFSGVESNIEQRSWQQFRTVLMGTHSNILYVEKGGNGTIIDGIVFQSEKKAMPKGEIRPNVPCSGFEPSIVAQSVVACPEVRNCFFEHLTANLYRKRQVVPTHRDSTIRIQPTTGNEYIVLQAPARQTLGHLNYSLVGESNQIVLNGMVNAYDAKFLEIIVLDQIKGGVYTLKVSDTAGKVLLTKQVEVIR